MLGCCQEWVGCPLLCAGQSHSPISNIYHLSNSTIVRGNKPHHYILVVHTGGVLPHRICGGYIACRKLLLRPSVLPWGSHVGVPPIPTCDPITCVVSMSGCKRKNLKFSRNTLFLTPSLWPRSSLPTGTHKEILFY